MPDEQLAGQDTPVVDNEVQTPEPEQENTGTTEAQTDGADGGKESPAQPAKTFTQEEVNAIVAREKAREARRALRELRQQPQQPVQPQSDGREPAQRPQVTREAVEAYLAEQRKAEAIEKFTEKAEEATERYPDYLTVVTDPRLPFNEEMIDFFAESDVGTDLAYHLAKNPTKAFAIARMAPLKAGRELTRLEDELKAKPKATPTKAPDPITPVGSRPTKTSTLPSDDDDMETWARKERERERARHR